MISRKHYVCISSTEEHSLRMPPKIDEEKVSLTRARRIVLGQFIYMDRRFQKYEGKVSERVVFILTPSLP